MNVFARCFLNIICIVASAACLCSCDSSSGNVSGMPWHTGDGTVDSLLDLADRLETSETYEEDRLRFVLGRIDSIVSECASPGMESVHTFVSNRLLVLDGLTDDIKATDSVAVELLDHKANPYLKARLRLHMAQHDSDLESKTDALFGILPDFIDARDSMRVVETLYELNTAYWRVWDNETQTEYMHEILNYVPYNLPTLKAVIRSNIVRLERNRKDTAAYLASLDTLRLEKKLMELAPALGLTVYSDLYRLRRRSPDLDTAQKYMEKLEIEHDASRVYLIQRLAQAVAASLPDSAAKFAAPLALRIGDDDTPIDMESMRALIPYYELIGDSVAKKAMATRLEAARRSAAVYERALKMARMNADRRIGELREYSESVHARKRVRTVGIVSVLVLCVVLIPAVFVIIWIRKRHRHEDSRLKNDLENARRRLTVAQMRSAEKENAISSALQDLENMTGNNDSAHEQTDALRRKLRLHLTGDDDWERFSVVFTEMRPGFVDNLKNEYPQLTRGDIRLCCLLDMDLDTKHIAQLLMIRPESVKKHRQRLRAKFGITPDVKWSDFFSRF